MPSLQQIIDLLYKQYDKDNSGTLCVTQLGNIIRDCYKQMGDTRNISDDDVRKVLKAMDKNNDGQISKAQLLEIFNKMK